MKYEIKLKYLDFIYDQYAVINVKNLEDQNISKYITFLDISNGIDLSNLSISMKLIICS